MYIASLSIPIYLFPDSLYHHETLDAFDTENDHNHRFWIAKTHETQWPSPIYLPLNAATDCAFASARML